MSSLRPSILALGLLAGMLAGLPGCGGRTPLSDPLMGRDAGSGLDQGLADRGGVVDTAPDVAPSFDMNVTPPDLPPPDLPVPDVQCVSESPFEIMKREGEVFLPTLARADAQNALLVYTASTDGSVTQQVHALAITTGGQATGLEQLIGNGQGGHLQPTGGLLDTPYALLYGRSSDGELTLATLTLEGLPSSSIGAGLFASTTRPSLAVSETAVAIAWDDVATATAQLLVADFGGTGLQTTLEGSFPWVALVPDGSGQFFVSTGTGQGARVERRDTSASLVSARDVVVPGDVTASTRVVGSPAGGLVLARSIFDPSGGTVIYQDLGGQGSTTRNGALAVGLDAAYDPQSDWLLAAVTGLGPDGYTLTFHGATRGGAAFTVTEAPFFSSTVALTAVWSPVPAIVSTGSPGRFLVVWAGSSVDGFSTLFGTTVTCSP